MCILRILDHDVGSYNEGPVQVLVRMVRVLTKATKSSSCASRWSLLLKYFVVCVGIRAYLDRKSLEVNGPLGSF